jgi:two-component system OmpR family sensor kinase
MAAAAPPPLRRGLPVQSSDFRRPLFFDLRQKERSTDLPWDAAGAAAAIQGEARYTTVVTAGGEKIRVYSGPLKRRGVIVAAFQLAYPLDEWERLLERQWQILFVLAPLALLVAGFGGYFLTNYALRPVREVTQAAARIGARDLSRRLEVRGQDELAELAATFNGMIARLEATFRELGKTNQELEAACEKLAKSYEEQRRFTGDASHELRTPLARIKGSTSLALLGPHSIDDYREALAVADDAADAMSRIVQDLLLLARADAGQLPLRLQPAALEEVIQRAILALRGRPGAPIHLRLSAAGLEVAGDSDHLTRLLVNLLENALRHTPADGAITVAAEPVGDRVIVTVADTGEGIAPRHLPHVCERFYRADTVRTGGRGGTGLGLAICQSIVQAHHGSLSIESEPGRGTTVRVTLPTAGQTSG